jgi:hypothetical protein
MHSLVYNGSMSNQINRLSRKNHIQNADLEKFIYVPSIQVLLRDLFVYRGVQHILCGVFVWGFFVL